MHTTFLFLFVSVNTGVDLDANLNTTHPNNISHKQMNIKFTSTNLRLQIFRWFSSLLPNRLLIRIKIGELLLVKVTWDVTDSVQSVHVVLYQRTCCFFDIYLNSNQFHIRTDLIVIFLVNGNFVSCWTRQLCGSAKHVNRTVAPNNG